MFAPWTCRAQYASSNIDRAESIANAPLPVGSGRRPMPYTCATRQAEELYLPGLEKEEFLENLAMGRYRNIVVLTGAGVSTSAGVPDYRSGGGMFETLRKEVGEISLPSAPEALFSRNFANNHPNIFWKEVLPAKQALFQDLQPTPTHRFCAYLAQKSWLKRLYTQNVDGLHTHPSLNMNEELLVECHGSMRRGDLVLYGDGLPKRFFDLVSADFDPNIDDKERVDLVLVFGTSLRVAPFCGIPNLAPKHCHRVLVNRNLADCLVDHPFKSNNLNHSHVGNKMPIGSHKAVSLSPLWCDKTKARKKRWRQLMVSDDCDDFVADFQEMERSMGRKECK